MVKGEEVLLYFHAAPQLPENVRQLFWHCSRVVAPFRVGDLPFATR
jgi:hypothetical protein